MRQELTALWTFMLAGMLVFLGIMASILDRFVKIPGGHSARYWSLGSILILLGMASLILAGAQSSFLLHIGSLALFLAGHVLQWRGLRLFYHEPPGRYDWHLAAAFLAVYCVLLLSQERFALHEAYFSLVPILVWPLCIQQLVKNFHPRHRTAPTLAIFGLSLLLVDAFLELALGLLPIEDLFQRTSFFNSLIEVIVPIFGSLLYIAALIQLYFERAGDQANFAATHDELTGILNRRAIIAGGEREIERSRRNFQSLTVAFVDIDFFKKVNDLHGHKAGDRVLREVANILALSCRTVDLVGRYGGEEFCMVFPGEHQGGAEIIGQRLVDAVRQHAFIDMPAVTISVGLAVLPPDDEKLTWYSLIELADLELYKAKQNGRDQYAIQGKLVTRSSTSPSAASAASGIEALKRNVFFSFSGKS